jgi:hypothetical protein
MGSVKEVLERSERGGVERVHGAVIVDDFVGTGNQMSENLGAFFADKGEIIVRLGLPVVVVIVCATQTGEDKVRRRLKEVRGNSLDVYVCEGLEERYCAFGGGKRFWEDEEEKWRAKELCQKLGVKIVKRDPLGFGDQGLLVVFPWNCPNNSLPVLHGSTDRAEKWKPLFPRRKS